MCWSDQECEETSAPDHKDEEDEDDQDEGADEDDKSWTNFLVSQNIRKGLFTEKREFVKI